MDRDLFNSLSRAELKKEISAYVESDNRSLPPRAKIFSAVARMQNFDMIPEVASSREIDALVAAGATDLNRGISSSNSLSAVFYARELMRGPLYPGTLTAFGHGIYFAKPSVAYGKPGFSTISCVAENYAKTGSPGVIVRCALNREARCLDSADLKELFRDNKNRAREVGIIDIGTLAAALGFDAFYCDGVYEHTDEQVWVVVNRGALTFQNKVEKIGLQAPI